MQRNFILHTETFTQKLLHAEVFSQKKNVTQRNSYTKKLARTAHRRVYTQQLLRIEAFVQRSLYLSFIMSHFSWSCTICHFSYLRFHALLVNSLRRLVFNLHGVLSVQDSSSLPLRQSRLNENPGINSD